VLAVVVGRFVLILRVVGRYAADSGLYWLRVASFAGLSVLKVFRAGVEGGGLCG
jgi:hypothetical protein